MVRAKDGKDYYIETANSEQPSDSRFVVHAGSDMHGEWIGSFPTKKEAVEFLQSKKAKAPETPKDAPEPTPAPEGSVTVFRGEDGRFSGADSEGTFFSADKDVAAGYGNVTEARLELESPMTFDFDGRSRVFFDGEERSPSEPVSYTHLTLPTNREV